MRTDMSVQSRLFTTAVCLGFIIVQLDVSIVNVGLEALRQAYHANIADLEWIINTYSLLFAALLLSSGRLGERYGVRKIFITGVAIFISASVGCAIAPSLLTLNLFRGIQGIGAALLVPCSLTLIKLYFSDPATRTYAVGMWAASGGFSLAAGPILGGTLIKLMGWKSIFLINVPVGILCIIITLKFAPESTSSKQKFNFGGQLLVALTLGLMTFALTEAGRYGLMSTVTLLPLAAGLIALWLFVSSERRAVIPVLAPSVLKNPMIINALLIGFICNLVFYGSVFILSIFFQSEMKLDAFQTGFAFLPMMLFTALVNFSCGWLSRFFNIKTLVVTGAVMSFVGFSLLLLLNDNWTLWQIFIPTMLLGGGTCLGTPVMATLILSEARDADAGSASALFACARQVGGVTGVALFGLVINTIGTGELISGLKVVAGAAMLLVLLWMYIGSMRLLKHATRNQVL
ncbi:MFS transporter [Klebsiella sp. R390]|uniref:MFS transporter n=1 Tax=Klebsiella sp. R390 TaxID=2755400 RepID=UPI003DA8D857